MKITMQDSCTEWPEERIVLQSQGGKEYTIKVSITAPYPAQ